MGFHQEEFSGYAVLGWPLGSYNDKIFFSTFQKFKGLYQNLTLRVLSLYLDLKVSEDGDFLWQSALKPRDEREP